MKAQVISFKCVLKDSFGNVISQTVNQEVLTQAMPQSELLPDLATGLQNLKRGETRQISIGAERAYGFYDPKKVIEVDLEDSPRLANVKLGTSILWESEQGEEGQYRVIERNADTVFLDGNHPLAGRDLVFEVEALSTAREATPEEVGLDLLN